MKSLSSILPALLISVSVYAQSGSLDANFDGDGMVYLSQLSIFDQGNKVLVQPDGKILIAGGSRYLAGSDLSVHRLNPDGSYDNSFGTNGRVSIDANGDDGCMSIALQADGKIVLVGATSVTNGGILLYRLNQNGTFDTTFGSAGAVTVPLGSVNEDPTDIRIQSDGKIVIAGNAYIDPNTVMVICRLNADGTLDTTFSFDGIVTTVVHTDNHIQALWVTPDNKITVVGSTFNVVGPTRSGTLMRFNSDGSPDNTLGINGVILNDFSNGYGLFEGLAIDNNGKIVVIAIKGAGQTTDMALLRYNPDGSLDNSFSFDGMLTIDYSNMDDAGHDVLIQPDNKILVCGSTRDGKSRLALVRFSPDGILDNSFGTNGKAIFPISSEAIANSISLQPDGMIVLTGITYSPAAGAIVARVISGINIGIGEVDTYIGSTLVYPNPITNNTVTVEYELKSDETVSIELFDLGGKHIAQLQSQMEQTVGSYQKTLSLPELSAGKYLLKLNTEQGSVSVKVLVN